MSEKRDSNPRPRPWQGRALPTELFSQFSLLANPLASLSCPVFVVCVAKVGIIFELANLLAKKIPFAMNFPLFFLFRLPLQPPQPRFHPPHPSPRAALSLRTRISTATPLRGSIPTTVSAVPIHHRMHSPHTPLYAQPHFPPALSTVSTLPPAPQGRIRAYPRAQRQRSAWGVGSRRAKKGRTDWCAPWYG